MAKSKLVVVWGCENIFGSSIKLFLEVQKDWTVVNISDNQVLKAMILAAEAISQEVVIILQGDQHAPVNLPLSFLKDHSAIKVITLGLENNDMEVYSKQKILLEEATDLIKVIEDGV